MYKKKFASAKEAYDYTAARICLVKDATALLNNYMRALQVLGATTPTIARKEYSAVEYRAFDAEYGKVATNEIVIFDDGTVSI